MEKSDNVLTLPSGPGGEMENWITVVDASVLLNHSEAHIWRLIKAHGWTYRKELENGRKKAFVLRKLIEDYAKQPARQKVDPLKGEGASKDTGTANQQIDPSGIDLIGMKERIVGNAVAEYVKENKTLLTKLNEVQNAKLLEEKRAIKWRTSTFYWIAIAIISSGILGLWLYDTKDELHDKSKAVQSLSGEITNLKVQLAQELTQVGFSKNNNPFLNPLQESDYRLEGSVH